MRKKLFAVAVAGILTVCLVAASSPAPRNLLSNFRAGQHIGLLPAPNGLWQIIVHNEAPASNGQTPPAATVTEVGTDYIAVRDGANESRIPIYAISSVISFASPNKASLAPHSRRCQARRSVPRQPERAAIPEAIDRGMTLDSMQLDQSFER